MNPLKKLLLVLITTTLFGGIYAQLADSVYYERLYYTCKAWGHAKYYHSRIAAGLVDWDHVLYNVIPNIKNAPDNQTFNNLLLAMLQQAGETEAGIEPLPEVPDSLNNNIDLSWIYHPIFSNDVSALLDTILKRFTPRPNVYIGSYDWGSINFEDSDNLGHNTAQYPNERWRILALFRYWNIIHYFFPYKYIMDQDWDSVLLETIPEIVTATNALEYHLAMRVFTAKINDSHAFFFSQTLTNFKGVNYTPFLAKIIENKVVVTKVHPSVSELHKGDIITKIDGFDMDYLRDSLRIYSHGSHEVNIERELIKRLILWGALGEFSLTVLNETGEHTFNLYRGNYYNELYQDNTPYWRETILNGCRFGIIHMGNLYDEHIPEIVENMNNVDAIIFDVRNYPHETLWTLVDYFFEDPLHIANFKRPDRNYPGTFFWDEEWIGEGTSNPIRKKTIILFNEETLSQAEYTCMGLEQIPGAIKIGSTTAAGDGNISYIRLPGGFRAMASFLGVFYPDYTPTQRIGIIPDYYVLPTIQGIREGRDEVLEFALNCAWVGMEELKITNYEFQIYPNPTSGELRVTSYK
jgi:hypothetical protein